LDLENIIKNKDLNLREEFIEKEKRKYIRKLKMFESYFNKSLIVDFNENYNFNLNNYKKRKTNSLDSNNKEYIKQNNN
jgi:hypothetical protein